MIEFGNSLRAAREAKGYTVVQLAEQTHVAPSTISELEAEDFSRIAAPIYGRGFVKLYCEAVELDPKPFVEAFMEIYTGNRETTIRERPVSTEPAVAETAAVTAPEPEIPAEPPNAERPLDLFQEPPAAEQGPTTESPDPIARPDADPLARYATPLHQRRHQTFSPAIWRIGALAVAVILILWLVCLGIRTVFRAAPADKAPNAPKPVSVEKNAAPRTPQKIPSLYID